jgi:hypothetical protein
VQISQSLLILGQTQLDISLLESIGTSGLDVVDDLDNFESRNVLTMVFREIFVWVAGAVGNLLGSLVVCLASELTTVDNGAFTVGLVAGADRCVLDGADNALAAKNLAEDNMLSVKVGSRYGGDEELRAISAWPCD